MDKYIHASQTKLLSDIMTGGFEESDSVLLGMEILNNLVGLYRIVLMALVHNDNEMQAIVQGVGNMFKEISALTIFA